MKLEIGEGGGPDKNVGEADKNGISHFIFPVMVMKH